MTQRDVLVVLFTMGFIVILALLSVRCEAQTYVLCESIVSGSRQAFEGSCPQGWIYIGPA